MFAWAMLINNLGRRRYPQHWWKPERTFVRDQSTAPKPDEEIVIATSRANPTRQAEDNGRTGETLQPERMQGVSGDEGDLNGDDRRAGRFERDTGNRGVGASV